MQYSQYLTTEHWEKTRKIKLLEKNSCQICYSKKSLVIHHKLYKHRVRNKSILFNERKEDLITLCASCHSFVHHHFGINVKKINKKICRVRRMLVLGTTKKMAFYIASKDELFITVRNKLSN